jgi:hypothetical protein
MKKHSPRTVRTEKELCALRSDNRTVGDAWILMNGPCEVVIATQKLGEKATGMVKLTKDQFNRMIRWYQTPTRAPK